MMPRIIPRVIPLELGVTCREVPMEPRQFSTYVPNQQQPLAIIPRVANVLIQLGRIP